MKRVFFLAVIALLVVGTSLTAQQNHKRNNEKCYSANDKIAGKNCMQPIDRMKANLDLTDEQVSKISDLKFKHENIALDKRNNIQKNQLAIRKMMTDNQIDKNELLNLVSKNSELQTEIKLAKTTMWLDIYNFLDDTQKVKWANTFAIFCEKGSKFYNKEKHGFRGNNCDKFPKDRM